MRELVVLAALAACSFQGKSQPLDDARPTTDAITGDADLGDWWDGAWPYRRPVLVDTRQVADHLEHFPVLVRLPNDFDYAHATTDGRDLRFVDADGTAIPFEIDTFRATGSAIWVAVTLDPDPPTRTFWLYYGNRDAAAASDGSAVWTTDTSVYHLADLRDATGGGRTGLATPEQLPQPTPAMIGDGALFDGIDDHVTLPDEHAYDYVENMTVSTWVKLTGDAFARAWQCYVCKGDHTWRMQRSNTSKHVDFGTNNAQNVDSASNVDVGWHHIAIVLDGAANKKYVYVNGALDGNGNYTDTLDNIDAPVMLGENAEATGRFHAGILDEVRLSGVARSAAWIAAEHATVTVPTFAVVGDPEMR